MKTDKPADDWWWIAMNGPSCAASPFGSIDVPAVVPTPEQLIGYRTQEEQLAAQQLILKEPIERVNEYMHDLPKRIDSGEVRCVRPECPESLTRGPTQWIVPGRHVLSPCPRSCDNSNASATKTVTSLLPKEAIAPLKTLGRTDWLKIVTEGSNHRFEISDSIFETLNDEPDFLQALLSVSNSEGSLLLQFLAYSRLLADGPKIVQPTAEQCETLAHVDLNLKFRDYEQPFPAFVVEVPVELRRQLTKEHSFTCPRFVIPFHDRANDFLTVLCSRGVGEVRGGVFTVFSRNMLDDTMEDSLRRVNGDSGPDYEQAMVLERIALNLSLLLTCYGFHDDGPVDPNAFEKQSKLAKSKSERKQQRARRLLDSSFKRISLNQEVRFVNKVGITSATGDGHGSLKSPHWRRGHFRRARVGVGRSETRLTFVRPSFINAQHFDGDRADTQYRIRTDKAELACSA